MPFTSTFAGVPDHLVEHVRKAVERLRERASNPHEVSALIAEAVAALEATRPHVLAENQSLLDHFVEQVMNPERAVSSGH